MSGWPQTYINDAVGCIDMLLCVEMIIEFIEGWIRAEWIIKEPQEKIVVRDTEVTCYCDLLKSCFSAYLLVL